MEGNERNRILNMVKEGKITIDEAENLLDALASKASSETQLKDEVAMKDTRGRKSKKLRILIDANDSSDKAKVNVAIPLSLVRTLGPVVVKSIPKDARDKLEDNGVDIEQILSEIENLNLDEDIVNIDSGESDGGTAKVRIYVE